MVGSLECAVTRPFTCEKRGVLGSHAEKQGYHETGTWLKCVLSSSHLQCGQGCGQALLSFPAPCLPSGCLSFAPLAGGWWRVHWLFLTNDAHTPTLHTNALSSHGTDQLLLRCFGPSGCPSLGLDPTPSISRHASRNWLTGCQTMTPHVQPIDAPQYPSTIYLK